MGVPPQEQPAARTFGRALWLTVAGTVLPGFGLWKAGRRRSGAVAMGVAAAIVCVFLGLVLFQRNLLAEWAVNVTGLMILSGFLAVLGVLWVSVVVASYLALRPRPATAPQRIGGAVLVALLCLAVAAPIAFGARLAYDQADFLASVFRNQVQSATKPTIDPATKARVNILLLGGDSGAGRDAALGARTDTVMLASIDTRTGATTIFQLPRQTARMPFPKNSPLYKYYPDGFYDGRDPTNPEFFLNAEYSKVPARTGPDVLGPTSNLGADVVKLSVGEALGLPVDYYVFINLDGFVDVVDALGGIEVNVNYPVAIGGESNADVQIPPDGYFPIGPNLHLNGYWAEIYARSRYGNSDYSRMARQTCVINAIVKKADPANLIAHYQELMQAGKKIILTDVPSDMLPALVDLALKVKSQPLQRVVFQQGVGGYVSTDPDFAKMRQYVQRVLAEQVAAVASASASPSTSAMPTTTASSPASPAATPTASSSGGVENLTDDCAYHPTTTTVPGKVIQPTG